MLTFVKINDRPEAQTGKHDDLVMALAIAYHIRPRQRMTDERPRTERASWTEDMYEDYRNASEEGKRYLIDKWGDPF